MGEMHPSNVLFNKLANFNSFVGLLVVGFENEIIPHLRKMDTRRGHGIKALGGMGKPNASSCFEREIQKLECTFNYNRSPMLTRGRGRNNRDHALVQ